MQLLSTDLHHHLALLTIVHVHPILRRTIHVLLSEGKTEAHLPSCSNGHKRMRDSRLVRHQAMMWSSNILIMSMITWIKSLATYILHLQLYPDPDCNAFKLYNNSTSPFAVHTLPAARRFDDNLLPGENARLDCGRWRLRLGKGLDFEIRVLPNTHREAVHCSLISPITTVFPSKPKSKTESPKNPEKGIFERLAKSEIASVGKKVLKAERTGQGGRENQYLSHSKTPMLNETIGRTTRTQVFKATRNGMLVAIKMCRNLN